jgi:hypothetical protein
MIAALFSVFLLIVFFSISAISGTLSSNHESAIDSQIIGEKLYVQNLNAEFFRGIMKSGFQPAAFFMHVPFSAKPLIFHCFRKSLRNGDNVSAIASKRDFFFELRTRLCPEEAKFMDMEIMAGILESFRGFRRDGSVFYKRGFQKRFTWNIPSCGCTVEVSFVPFSIGREVNDAFACDLGELKIIIPSIHLLESHCNFSQLFHGVFSSDCIVPTSISADGYFLDRSSYSGYARGLIINDLDRILNSGFLLANHKMTLNKHIDNSTQKYCLDMEQCLSFFESGNAVLSQDERLKRAMVPEWVELRPERIPQTDIGTGQNVFVFLSMGSGINYFDDPWKKERQNLPAPRFVYSPLICWMAGNQFYPSYSIDCGGKGAERLNAINSFQTGNTAECSLPVEMDAGAREAYLKEMERRLLEYGLLNDSPVLEKGFLFQGKLFTGNIVNNEVRVREFSNIPFETMHLIIPPCIDKSDAETSPENSMSYFREYEKRFIQRRKTKFSSISRIPNISNDLNNLAETEGIPIFADTLIRRFPGGTPWREYFFQSGQADDKSMRAAYLEIILMRTHAMLARLLRLSRRGWPRLSTDGSQAFENGSQGLCRPGYWILAGAMEKIIRKAGMEFFETPQAMIRRGIEAERLKAWYSLLKSLREKRPECEIKENYRRFIRISRFFWTSAGVDDETLNASENQ